ncbi:hypothetical protein F2P47_04130 [Parvibaculum sedimenti]|uniref:Lipoprotein n=1 Tax=Parvibaculum sedimenti TaxID=2608632 RepID=A0A6N6VK29_9HYPH|nr:hypothetical protein [Parvibaculum sedimenti]KAB7741599.1 hypothetical protein F2P47_04130 [Parvibaculum sedimenti]
MTTFIRKLTLLCAFFLVAGCAAKPAVPFDRSTASSIKVIGLLTPDVPSEPSAVLASSVGQSFGLIGALVDAGMKDNRDGSLRDVLAAQKFAADKALTDDLTASLKSRGYEVKLIPVSRNDKGKLLKTYPTQSENQVDAYLDVVSVNYGYVAAGIAGNTPYRPFLYTDCKLVKASDGAVLMEDSVNYNPIMAAGADAEHVTISPDPAYSFEKFSEIEADPAKATKGVSVAFAQTTDAIGRLLR